jgi:nicotinate-nucleotide adenylyltransferase
VAALRAAAASGRYDLIEVTVAGDPYLKRLEGNVRDATLRLAMAEAAFGELGLVEVSDREIRRDGPSYTIDTVRELLSDAESVDLIVGADLSEQLDRWHEADELRTLVRVGVVPRPGAKSVVPDGWVSYEIPMDPVDLSSSYVRGLEPTSTNLRQFLPASVIPLYQSARG